MPFPTAHDKKSLIEIVHTAQQALIGLKSYTQSLISALDKPMSINQILDYLDSLRRTTSLLTVGMATPGLIGFIQEQFYDTSVDLVAEAQNLLATIANVQAAVMAIVPVNGDHFIQKDVLEQDGSVTVTALQPEQLAALADPFQQLVSAID